MIFDLSNPLTLNGDRLIFNDSRTKSDRRRCLRKLDLVFCLPNTISDLTLGVNGGETYGDEHTLAHQDLVAPDMYAMLKGRPPLPLQICFDDIVAQLLSRMFL